MPMKTPATRAWFAALIALVCVLALPNAHAGNTRIRWSDARQLVLVTTPDWDAANGSLSTYKWTRSGWKPTGLSFPVSIGRSGSAWGSGLHSAQPGPVKKEGDGRSPAGVFRLGTAFGYAGNAATEMPYLAMRDSHYCVDVVGSPLYNQIVDTRTVGASAVAGSTEPMRRDIHAGGDQRYKLGLVIEHNAANVPGAGSCIFAHVWKAPGEPTSGCTAMNESSMRKLLGRLQPRRHPVFVLLPASEYQRLRRDWRLPALPRATSAQVER